MPTWYPNISPLCVINGGGNQEAFISLDESVTTERLCGSADGTSMFVVTLQITNFQLFH